MTEAKTKKDIAPKELADAALEKGTFKLLQAVRERAYPRHEVRISLDEQLGWMAAKLEEQIEAETELQEKTKLEDKLDEIVEQMSNAMVTFKLRGISEGRREELLKMAYDEYPEEVIETKNPFTGRSEREEKEVPERDRYFTDLLWAAHIEAVEAPDGSVQVGVNAEEVRLLREELPLAATAALNEGMVKLREGTAIFMAKAEESFFPKS